MSCSTHHLRRLSGSVSSSLCKQHVLHSQTCSDLCIFHCRNPPTNKYRWITRR
jgi:hypothetical protein